MTEPAFLEFRLGDPTRSYQKVNVAGSFNNWNPEINELKFNDKSKSWLLDLAVELKKNDKVYYKYITDNTNWICDDTKPSEADESGIENNVTYVILKKDLSAVKAIDVDKNDELFDHKSFHDGELFDSATNDNNIVEDSAPTSGDNFAPESVVSDNDQNKDNENFNDNDNDNENGQVALSTKDLQSKDIPPEVPADKLRPTSLWESIKWFLRYYVFAWLFPSS